MFVSPSNRSCGDVSVALAPSFTRNPISTSSPQHPDPQVSLIHPGKAQNTREKQRANSPRARKHPGDPEHHLSLSRLQPSPLLLFRPLVRHALHLRIFHFSSSFSDFTLKKRRQYPQTLRARRAWCVGGTEEDLCEELRARGRWAPKARGRGLGANTASDWPVWRVSCREGISGVGGCKHWIYILRRRDGSK